MTATVASLPMYDWDAPEMVAAHDRLWSAIRDGLRARDVAAPEGLDRSLSPMESWAHPGLVLGQICNLPYRALFRDRVTLIGTADYGVEAAGPGHYNSVMVVRADDPAMALADCDGYRLAWNEALSQSGWGAPWAAAQEAGVTLRPHLHSHAHRSSIVAVAEGRADLAGIDAVSFRLARRYGLATGLRVIGRTPTSPGMSFITAQGRDPAPYFAAIAGAIGAMSSGDTAILGLRGIVALPHAAYDLPLPPDPEALAA